MVRPVGQSGSGVGDSSRLLLFCLVRVRIPEKMPEAYPSTGLEELCLSGSKIYRRRNLGWGV